MPRTGRPRKFDRGAALTSAMHLFWKRGFEGASVELLRSEMGGLSPASFYAAFGSKEALYREAVMHYAATHGHVIAALHDENLAPRERIEQAFRSMVDMQGDPSHPAGCIVSLSALPGFVHQPELRELTAGQRDINRTAILKCVRDGIVRGELRAETNELGLATLLYTLLVGFTTQLVDGVPMQALQEAITSALTVWDQAAPGPASRHA